MDIHIIIYILETYWYTKITTAGMNLISPSSPCHGSTLVLRFLHSISDIENSIVGVPPKLAGMIKPLIEKVDPDVVCFGCVLFEVSPYSPRPSLYFIDLYAFPSRSRHFLSLLL